MHDRSMAIAILCSHLCEGEGCLPLEPKEYSALAERLAGKELHPEDLLTFGAQDYRQLLELTEEQTERLLRLFDRSAALSFEISKYESMGIRLITRADELYPKKLRKKLKNGCPPLFYVAGELALLEQNGIGYVGSRSIGTEDVAFEQDAVRKTTKNGFSTVSGGARGCDIVAEETALNEGGTAIAWLSDSMLRKLRDGKTLRYVQQGKLLLLSVAKPDAGFNTGFAMMRNKYIYAQSEAAVVIKADYNKGGTWNGAVENLRHHWAIPLCRDHLAYPGNKALIGQGAIPVDETWDGTLEAFRTAPISEEAEQLNFLDTL